MIDTHALYSSLVHTGFLSDLLHEAVDQVIAARRLHQPTVDEVALLLLAGAMPDPAWSDCEPASPVRWSYKVAEAFVAERSRRAATAKGGG